MPLPSTGPLSLEDIRLEFGGSAPVSLSQYYRGGPLVPDIAQNVGIPTSGTISVGNFYGAAFADLVPNSVDWANINMNPVGSTWFPVSGFAEYFTNSNQTISSISQNITLGIDISSASFTLEQGQINADLQISLERSLNGNRSVLGTLLQGPSGTPASGRIGTISAANNDALHFGLNLSASTFTPQEGYLRFSYSATVSIVNTSSSNTVLDTFTLNIGAQAGFFN